MEAGASMSAAGVPALLRPGMSVWVGGGCNEPVALLEALRGQPDAARGVTFTQFPLPGLNGFDFTDLHPEAELITFFMTPALAGSRAKFLPMRMRAAFDHLRAARFDLAFIAVGRRADGSYAIGPNADFAAAVLETAGSVVAELRTGAPLPAGALPVAAARLDHIVASARRPTPMPRPAIDAAARRIGARVAGLVADGDCLQTGIGGIPAAVLQALTQKNDLGLHGGLIDDGGMALVVAGNVTGAAKTIDVGRHVTGMALGSGALHDWLAERGDVVFRGVDYTHDLDVLRRIDRFVSINSALQVDLFGQVNAEMAGGRQRSGVGGAVDFMRGAAASRGGRSIVALPATARGGGVSRIVPRVELVTASRTDVDCVVTEFGVAELAGKTADARRAALIAIAHPDFRAELSSG